jgi:hypothetical protein
MTIDTAKQAAGALSPTDYRLVMHIGLPKTATTFLQHEIFGKSDRIKLFHRSNEVEVTTRMEGFLRNQNKHIGVLNERNLSPTLLNIVSNENITIGPLSMWRNQAIVSPQIVSERLDALVTHLFSKTDAVKVILTIRRQDRWLASRYAESARIMDQPSQLDFEDKIVDVIENNYAGKGIWLNYHHIVGELTKFFSRDHVLVLMQEDLAVDPTRWTRALEQFLGVSGLTTLANEAAGRRGKQNVLSSTPGHWKLKSHHAEIELTKDIADRIMGRYRDSNEQLALDYLVDGGPHGYY